jgi:hypothetical protein
MRESSHVHGDEGRQLIAQRSRIDTPVEGQERVRLLQPGHPGLNRVAGKAKLLGQGDEGAVGVFAERAQQLGIGPIQAVHTATR